MFDGTINTCLEGFRGYMYPKEIYTVSYVKIRGLGPITKKKTNFFNPSIATMSDHALISSELGVSTSNSTHDTFCLIDFYQHIVSINVCTSPDGIYGFQIIYNSIYPSNQIGLLNGTCKTVTYDRDSIYEIHVQTGPAPFPIKALHLKSSQKEVHFGKISI
jgi:hypothetical protein